MSTIFRSALVLASLALPVTSALAFTNEQATAGRAAFEQTCAMCHGETGKRMTTGRMQPPPTDFTLPKNASELTRKRMIASITNGRPGTAMRSYGTDFKKADIEAMADFINSAFISPAKAKK